MKQMMQVGPSRKRLLWALWSGVLAGVPYCVRNISAPAPGMMTLGPVCASLILTTLIAGNFVPNRAKRALMKLGGPATILFVLVELYGVARGDGPLLSMTLVHINDAISIVEFICAVVSISAWALFFDESHPLPSGQRRARSFCIGVIYAAICRAAASNIAPNTRMLVLFSLAIWLASTLLAYLAYGSSRYKDHKPRLILGGYLFFSAVHLLVEGGNPYYGMGAYGGSEAWYLAALAVLPLTVIVEHLSRYQQARRMPPIPLSPRHTLDKVAHKEQSSAVKAMFEMSVENGNIRFRALLISISLLCIILFVAFKCLSFILPPRYFSFTIDDLWTYGISASLIALSALLLCALDQTEQDCSFKTKQKTQFMMCLQMTLLGFALSDPRALVSLHGLAIAICFVLLICACGASYDPAGSDEGLKSWLANGLQTGVRAWRTMSPDALLLLPVSMLFGRCLTAAMVVFLPFDLVTAGILWIAARTLWMCRQALHKVVVSQKLEEASAARICRELGFGPLQTDVLLDTIEGYSINEICARRSTTINTVKSYRRRAYRALDVHSIEELRKRLRNNA